MKLEGSIKTMPPNSTRYGRERKPPLATPTPPLLQNSLLPFTYGLCAVVIISIVLAAARFNQSNGANTGQVGVFATMPAMIGLIIILNRRLRGALLSIEGKMIVLLSYLMLMSYTLGNDAFSAEDRILTISNIIGLPMVFIVGYLMSQIEGIERTLSISALLAVMVQSLIIIFTPAQIIMAQFERSAGLFSDPNIVILHTIPVFLMGWAFVTGNAERLLLLLTAPLALTAVALSASRSGSFALAGVIALVIAFPVLIDRKILRVRTLLWLGLAAVCGTVAVTGFFSESFDRGIASLTYRFTERTVEAGYLGDRWIYVTMFADRDLGDLVAPLGMGYHEFLQGTFTLAHNTFLDFYIIAGPLAFALFVGLYYQTISKILHMTFNSAARSASRWHAWLMLCSICSQAGLLMSLSVITMKVHWLILGLAAGSTVKLAARSSRFPRAR